MKGLHSQKQGSLRSASLDNFNHFKQINTFTSNIFVFKGPSPIIDIFFQTNDVRWGGGGVGACSFGRKIGIKFFLDWARGRAQQRASAAPIINATRRLRHLAATSRGRDSGPPVWSSVFDVDTLTAFVDLRQLVYCETVKGHTCIHCATCGERGLA